MKQFSIPFLNQRSIVQAPQEQSLPQIFYDRPSLKNFQRYLNGLDNARNSKLVITGCIRDIPIDIFKRNLDRCCSLGTLFESYKIVLIENDSNPEWLHTIKVLKGYGNVLISHKYGYEKLGSGRDQRRVTIMSKLRNEYMDYIGQNLSDYEYTLVVDMDLYNWRLDGIINSIGYDDWDMIGANGVQERPKNKEWTYYDTFALLEQNGHSYQVQESKDVLPFNSGLYPVMACFGGLGIYKTKSLLAGKRYSIYKMQDKVTSEQCGIHINMAKAGYQKIFINPNMVVVR